MYIKELVLENICAENILLFKRNKSKWCFHAFLKGRMALFSNKTEP